MNNGEGWLMYHGETAKGEGKKKNLLLGMSKEKGGGRRWHAQIWLHLSLLPCHEDCMSAFLFSLSRGPSPPPLRESWEP